VARATVIGALEEGGFILAGSFDGTAVFEPGKETEISIDSAGGEDLFIARYDNEGKLLWLRRAFGESDEAVSDIAVVQGDSFFLAGTMGAYNARPGAATIFDYRQPGESVLQLHGEKDMFLVRFDAEGNVLWARQSSGVGNEYGLSLSPCPVGGIMVGGYFGGVAVFGAGEPSETKLSTFDNWSNAFLASYNPSGALDWAFDIGSSRDDQIVSIHSLSDGSFVAAGAFSYVVDFDPSQEGLHMLESDGETDIFIAGFDAAKRLLWVKRAGGPGSDILRRLVALPDGSLVATGDFGGGADGYTLTSTFGPGETGETVLSCQDQRDFFLAKFAPDGSCDWATSSRSTADWNNWSVGQSVSAAHDGLLVAGGFFSGAITFGTGEPGEETLVASGPDDYDAFVAAFGKDGSLVWACRVGGEWNEEVAATLICRDGRVLLAGVFGPQSNFSLGAEEGLLQCPPDSRPLVVAIEQ